MKFAILRNGYVARVEAVSAKANLRKQVKRSGRSQNLIQQMRVGLSPVVSQANSRSDVKRSGRSQNGAYRKDCQHE